MLTLRSYQGSVVDRVQNSFAQGNRAVLCVVPTGGGKTVIFSHIAERASSKGKRVLILVHRIELLRQTSQALIKSGVMHGLISPKFTARYDLPVQVASIQTLGRRLAKYVLQFDLVIVDEAHHAIADTWRTVINSYGNARVLGVTATPIRVSGKGLGVNCGGMFDDLVIGPQVSELIALGFLSKPIVFAPKNGGLDMSNVKIVRGEYDNSEVMRRVDKPQIVGDVIEHYRQICDGMPGVAFCCNVEHAEHVASEFRAAGYRSEAVDGSMNDSDRKRILSGLADGRQQMVTSCDLISEGTDIPVIACGIQLRPTASLGLYLQQVGRTLRIFPGKKNAFILDHVGNVFRHGLPDQDREWSLDGLENSRARRAREADEKMMFCPSCYVISAPARICPACGFSQPAPAVADVLPTTGDGVLDAVSQADLDAIKMEKLKERGDKNKEESACTTFEQLQKLGASRGYKPGWAIAKWNARQNKQVAFNSDLVP